MRALFLCLAAGSLFGCQDSASAPVQIVAGAAPDDDVTLVPRASLAEYIEVSQTDSTLLVTLSSDARSCNAEAPPPADSLSFSLRLLLPGGAKPEPGTYPVLGADGDPQRARVLATAKVRGKRVEFPAGGVVEIRKIELAARGSIEGLLKLEFPGTADRAATRVSGTFSALLCRVSRLGGT